MSAVLSDGMSAEAPVRSRGVSTRLGRLLARAAGWLLGALLCLTPLTAVLAQGWLMARMRRIALGDLDRKPLALRLWRIARLGGEASLALFIGLAPLTFLLLFSWWGGWENSFNKGYEQSWVGPTLALAGVVLGLPLLARAPMALAHQAAEGRLSAFFERRAVNAVMARAGWEHVALAAAFVLAAAPLLGAKALPVFVEQIRPGFESMSEQEVRRFAFLWRVGAAAYLFGALWLLRGWSARLYVKARGRSAGRTRWRLGPMLRHVLVCTLWLLLIAQLYIGQFMHHRWIDWLNPPLAALPLAPGLGG